jgi:signal transduction histidine kinase
MDRFAPWRASVGISCAFAVLVMLACVQYRWSEELVANDIRLTKAHLSSSAQSFSDEFDHRLADLYIYIQTTAADAVEGGSALENVPRLFGPMYDVSRRENRYTLRRVERDGSIHEIEDRDKLGQAILKRYGANASGGCWSHLWSDIPAVVAPISVKPTGGPPHEPNHCIIAALDSGDVKNFLSEAIHRNFGSEPNGAWTFSVVATRDTDRTANPAMIYGNQLTSADLGQKFFGFRMDNYINERMGERLSPRHPFLGWMGPRNAGPPPSGLWDLQVKHKAGSIETSVAGWRRGTLLIAGLLEVLLMATITIIMMSAQRMRQLGEQKVQFAAGVSHELRTPVSAIGLLSRNMASGLVVRPDAIQRYGAMIYEQTQRLNQMVEQTLQFAGIESLGARPALKEVSIQKLIDEVVQRHRDNLTQAGFDLTLDVDNNLPAVMADAHWLERAMENLLNNAEKYTGETRWIGIRACYSVEGREVLITVEDRGIGIDPADFHRIFQPFSRGRRAVEAQIPGSGIGLALVRRTVEAHHGRITFASEPNQGSSFTLHFPAVSTAASR